MKTLVIEDDASSSSMFRLFFEKFGKCDTVSLGNEGVQAYREAFNFGQPYDLIVIDIILPDMNGKEILDIIREEESSTNLKEYERVKIVLTTSLDDEQNQKIKETLQVGLEAYYVKQLICDGLQEKLLELNLPVY